MEDARIDAVDEVEVEFDFFRWALCCTGKQDSRVDHLGRLLCDVTFGSDDVLCCVGEHAVWRTSDDAVADLVAIGPADKRVPSGAGFPF